MKKAFAVFSFAVLVPAFATASDQDPEFLTGSVSTCDGIRAFMGMDYTASSKKPYRALRILSTVCVDHEGSWFVGPDTKTGFVETMKFTDDSRMFEIIEESADSPGRSRLAIIDLNLGFPEEIDVDAYNVSVSLEPTATGPMPDASRIQGDAAYGINGSASVLAAVSPGTWFVQIYPSRAANYGDKEVDFGTAEIGQMSFIVEKTQDGQALLNELEHPANLISQRRNTYIDFDINDGDLEIALSFDYNNRKLAAARGPKEYDEARVEIIESIGQGITTSTGEQLVGQGAGKIVAKTIEGASTTYPAWFSFLAVQLPSGVTVEDITEYFFE